MSNYIVWKEELDNLTKMVNQNRSIKDISQHYGVSRWRIYQVLEKWGIPTMGRKKKRILEGSNPELYWFNRALSRVGVPKEHRLGLIKCFKLPTHCPALGLELDYEGGQGKGPGWSSRHDATPSIDRIDSSKGYETGNIQVLSWRANRIKNDSTPEELCKLAAYMMKVTYEGD